MIGRPRRRLKSLQVAERNEAGALLNKLIVALESGRYGDMAQTAPALAELLAGTDLMSRIAVRAIRLFQESALEAEVDRPEIFFVVCLGVIADLTL